jgi:hypothetical protein
VKLEIDPLWGGHCQKKRLLYESCKYSVLWCDFSVATEDTVAEALLGFFEQTQGHGERGVVLWHFGQAGQDLRPKSSPTFFLPGSFGVFCLSSTAPFSGTIRQTFSDSVSLFTLAPMTSKKSNVFWPASKSYFNPSYMVPSLMNLWACNDQAHPHPEATKISQAFEQTAETCAGARLSRAVISRRDH